MDLLVQILLFFILGLALFAFDAWAGVGLYRAWYGMTHKDPLPPGQKRGFLVRRKASIRLAWALAIAALIAAISVRYGSFFQDSTRVTLTLLAMLVGLGLGLLAAPSVLSRLPGLVNDATDYVDAVERGDRRPGEDLRDAARKATDRATDKAADLAAEVQKRKKTPPSKPYAAPKQASKPNHGTPGPEATDTDEAPSPDTGDPASGQREKPQDWRSGVDDFLKK